MQELEAHNKLGMKHYTLGHFSEAIEEFEKAYDIKPEPIFLYNIGQSHWQNQDFKRAIFFYRRYLDAAPQGKYRVQIEQRIIDLEKALAEEKAMAMEKEKERAATPAVAPAPVLPAPEPEPVQPPPPPEPAEVGSASSGRGLRIAGIVVSSVGLVGIGAGIAFGVHSANLYSQANSGTYDQSKLDSSDTFRTLEWVAMGVGGAALATGVVLYIVGATKPSRSLSMVPLLAPGMGGMALAGGF